MAKRKRTSTNKSLDLVYMGQEPKVDHIESPNSPELVRILNWYNYMYDYGKGKPWLVKWMKDNNYSTHDLNVVKDSPDWAVSTTACWIAKINLNGTTFPEENINFVHSRIKQLLDKYDVPKEAEKPTRTAPSPHSRAMAKNNALADEAEGIVDMYLDDDHETMYDFLIRNEATQMAANFIKDKYDPILAELMSDDPDVKEAHGSSLKKWQKIYTEICSDLDRFVNNKKAVKVRAPRALKIKPASKIVEKVKYQKEDQSLKIVSVNPVEIVGASSVWLFNTKYRTLTNITTGNSRGLSVKGTTIIGFEENDAVTRKLRKPEEAISALLSSGKVALRKFMDTLTTAESKANGRINNNMIILRVIK